ncbi:MAG: hypothetical protein MHM6MM_005360 [Cercozoa sp. M6MM]
MSEVHLSEEPVLFKTFRKWDYSPGLSPFSLRVEARLRLAGIPYKYCATNSPSKKGRWPYLIVDGEEIADSQCIANALLNRDERSRALDAELTAEQKAIGKAFSSMCINSLYFYLIRERWLENYSTFIPKAFPTLPWYMFFVPSLVHSRTKRRCQEQGQLDHTFEEATEMAMTELRAVSDFLAASPSRFLFGDTVTNYDIDVYAFVAQFRYNYALSAVDSALSEHNDGRLAQFIDDVQSAVFPEEAPAFAEKRREVEQQALEQIGN